jgi:Haemolymph juvenile hormone binding protein (JHBP)
LFSGDTTNRFFNENWRDIVREIKPVLEETIAEVIHGIVRQVFDLYPLEQLLPDN